jgi:hypothetical protein
MSGGVVGWNSQGPALAPSEVSNPNQAGTFAAAERMALAKRPWPHYRLRIFDGNDLPAEVPADCNWAVGTVIGETSFVELGPMASGLRQGLAPSGFVRVAEVRAFPPVHSYYYPFLTNADYRELASTSLVQLWRERAMGLGYVIYRRSTGRP